MCDASVVERTVTGIPLWLLQEYLEELGARRDRDGWLRGEDWQVRLTQVEDHRIGSLRVGQVRMEVVAEKAAADRIWRALEPKLARVGG